MYSQGKGVSQNGAKAFEWFRKAAEQGNAEAKYYLGVTYSQGKGVPTDDEQAVEWWRKAAEQGNTEAQKSIGFMYA